MQLRHWAELSRTSYLHEAEIMASVAVPLVTVDPVLPISRLLADCPVSTRSDGPTQKKKKKIQNPTSAPVSLLTSPFFPPPVATVMTRGCLVLDFVGKAAL